MTTFDGSIEGTTQLDATLDPNITLFQRDQLHFTNQTHDR